MSALVDPFAVADAIAGRLADPDTVAIRAEHRQHLAYGPTGIALLHIERAATGRGPWSRAHAWLAAATAQPWTAGPDSHPMYGAPALAHALAAVSDHQPGRYQRALDTVDTQVAADVRRRLERAHRRLDSGVLPELAEFDAIRGLAGYAAYALRRDPHQLGLPAILDYCVRLTEPISDSGDTVPGWWTPTGPSGRRDARYPGGHANNGMAHGIGAVLAVLSASLLRGVTVPNHHPAIRTIIDWMDQWTASADSAWPYWVTRADLRTGRSSQIGLRRPSWCYGTVGLARAHQLAGLALHDQARQTHAEKALIAAINDPAQLEVTTDLGLCHGFAGLAHMLVRCAADADPVTARTLTEALPDLLRRMKPSDIAPAGIAARLVSDDPGLLDGAAGIGLGLLSSATGQPPRTRWDAFLAITT